MKIKSGKRHWFAMSMASAILLFLPIFACSCSNQEQASASLMQVNEDGTMSEVENMKSGGDLSASEIVALEMEINSRLQTLDYIDDSEVMLSYHPGNTETLCFQVCLNGKNLKEHIVEISSIMEEKLGSCDLEHSSIVDTDGNSFSIE